MWRPVGELGIEAEEVPRGKRRPRRAAAAEQIHRDERAKQQQLVGKRIEQLAEIGDEVTRTREHPVEVVRHGRENEDREGEESHRP